MVKTLEPNVEAEPSTIEVEEVATVKEEPQVPEVGTKETDPEPKKPSRRDKLKTKLDEKDARIAALEEKNDKSEAISSYGSEVFEDEKVKTYKENVINKDGTPISWSQAAEMAGVGKASQVTDAYFIPGVAASGNKAEATEMSMDELEARLEKDLAEGRLQV